MYRYDENIEGSNFLVIVDDVDQALPTLPLPWLQPANWTQAAGYISISKETCSQLPQYVYISGEQMFSSEQNYQIKYLDQKFIRYFDEREKQFCMKEISSKRNRNIFGHGTSCSYYVFSAESCINLDLLSLPWRHVTEG